MKAENDLMKSEIKNQIAVKQSTLDKMQKLKLELGLTSSESQQLIQVPFRSRKSKTPFSGNRNSKTNVRGTVVDERTAGF